VKIRKFQGPAYKFGTASNHAKFESNIFNVAIHEELMLTGPGSAPIFSFVGHLFKNGLKTWKYYVIWRNCDVITTNL